MSDLIRVLVFGTTGVGKTSLCNALTNQNQPVNDGVKGVTFKHYNYPPVELSSKNLLITDTVGLNESDKGTVKSKDAIKLLLNLLRDSKEGYNLLVHVIRIGRITQNELANYNFFVKIIADSAVPVILLVTGCENIEPMSKWKKENSSALEEMGLNYQDVVCTSFATSQRQEFAKIYESLRQESCQAISHSILEHARPEPVLIYSDNNGFMTIIKRAWNTFCNFFDKPEWTWNVEKNLAEMMRRLGLLEDEIRDLLKYTNMFGKKE